ncbi:hypothetical protein EsDP_00002270 [Epichloe bromicola]|uniref:Uncharacterized protein n=1 Tax=Epichloe bromicola TaxID=79588 RepID=A0ABQ0CKA2_9HYPO
MLSFAPTTIFAGPWDHRPSVSSPLSSSPIRASSPLSPVDRNALPQRQIQSSPIQQPKFKFASRPVRQNPLLRKREDLQDARRKNFLQNVRQKADEKAWQRRDVEGQFLKNSLLADIGRLSHDAPFLSETDLEDAMAFHQERPPTEDDEMPDEHPLDDDLEDMVASFDEHRSQSQNQGQTHGDQRPPSPTLSDEDYDDIFAELIAQEQEQSSIQSSAEHMDMS